MASFTSEPQDQQWWLQQLADYSALLHFVSNDPLRRHTCMRSLVERALDLPHEDIVALDAFREEIAQSKESISNEDLLLFLKLEIIALRSETPHNERDTMFDQALQRLGVTEARLSSFVDWMGKWPDARLTQWYAHKNVQDHLIQATADQEGLSAFTPFFTTRCTRRRLKQLIRAYDLAKQSEVKLQQCAREGNTKSQRPAMTPEEADKLAARFAAEIFADPALRRSIMTSEERRKVDSADMLAAVITAIIGLVLTPFLIGVPILIYAIYRMFAISFRT